MRNIFNNNLNEFNKDLFQTLLPICKHYYQRYLNIIYCTFEKIQEIFPLLTLKEYAKPPSMQHYESYIEGWLINNDMLTNIYPKGNFSQYGIYVFIRIPYKINEYIEVYDAYGVINWNNIESEHRHHLNSIGNSYRLCTHLNQDLEGYLFEEGSIMIILNAWRLISSYRYYDKTNLFDIQAHPHQ